METLTVQMEKILSDYDDHVQVVANKAIQKIAKESVEKLKSPSPHNTGDYARGWALKDFNRNGKIASVVVHNKTSYQLTHLLENGHLIANRDRQGNVRYYGRTRPIKHIEPVEEWANSELPAEIERELK